jgi:hypothetical protein
LLLILLFKLGKGSYAVVGGVLGALYVLSTAETFWLTQDVFNPNRVYFGTDTRAAELLMGSLVAVLAYRGKIPRSGPWKQRLVALGTAAFLVEMFIWFGVDPEENLWAARGGFPLAIGLGMLIFIATVEPGTLLNRTLSFRPLVEAGKLSYGAYVFQWPIILWLSPNRMGMSVWSLLPVYLVLTFGIAWVMDRYLERPIRRRKVFTPSQAWVAMAVSMLLLGGVATAVTAGAPPELLDADRAQEESERIVADRLGDEGIRFGYFGDSTAQFLGVGTFAHLAESDVFVPAGLAVQYGCGATGATDFLDYGGYTRREECADFLDRWRTTATRYRPQIAIVSIVTDVAAKQLPGTDDFAAPGEEPHDQELLDAMLTSADVLIEAGAHVVWLRNPQVLVEHPDHRESRMNRLNELIDEVARQRPGKVTVIDLGAWLRSQPQGEHNREIRPDLVHFTSSASLRVAEELIEPAMLELVEDLGLEP